MPDPLPTINFATRCDLFPPQIEAVTLIADLFGSELEGGAGAAALHRQFMAARSFPKAMMEGGGAGRVRHRHSRGQAVTILGRHLYPSIVMRAGASR